MKKYPIKFESVPPAIRDENQWVLWKNIMRHGKSTKVPFSVYGTPASSTDESTWSTYESVVMKFDERQHAGIGFVFKEGGGVAGIDLDGCRNPETGIIQEWAWKVIDRFKGYTEISPSATGVKIWITCSASVAKGINRKLAESAVSSKTPGIEIYTHGRYFAFTGKVIKGYESL
jgi:primase-polymerase (primpol)-like protein